MLCSICSFQIPKAYFLNISSQTAHPKEKTHASSNIFGHSDLFNLLGNHSAEELSHANLQRGQRFCIFQPWSQFEMDGSSSNTLLLNMRPSPYFLACLLSFLHACQLHCLLAYLLPCMHTFAYTLATSYSFSVFNELPIPSCLQYVS